MNSALGRTLSTILEHGSHAWRALETMGLVAENLDGPWPPDAKASDPPIAHSLAAMLHYTKQLHDQIGELSERESGPLETQP